MRHAWEPVGPGKIERCRFCGIRRHDTSRAVEGRPVHVVVYGFTGSSSYWRRDYIPCTRKRLTVAEYQRLRRRVRKERRADLAYGELSVIAHRELSATRKT